jgi:hypothetical protein
LTNKELKVAEEKRTVDLGNGREAVLIPIRSWFWPDTVCRICAEESATALKHGKVSLVCCRNCAQDPAKQEMIRKKIIDLLEACRKNAAA